MSLAEAHRTSAPGEKAIPPGPGAPTPQALRPSGDAPATPGGQGPARPFAGGAPTRESFREAKYRVQNRLINELDPKMDLSNQVEVKRQIEDLFGKIADEEGLALTRAERVRMLEQITDEILGLGPLEPLLRDETITEVMVNGPQQVYIEREGRLEMTGVTFQNDEHVMKIIQRIIAPIGRRIDESSPMVDARLADGSRVNAIIPPLSLVGPVLTIRKFAATPVHGRRPDPLRHRHAGDVRVPRGLREGPAQHLRLRRHRLRQDDDPEHPQRRSSPTTSGS